VPIPTQNCMSSPQVLFNAWATQWPIGSTAGALSLYFEFSALTAINGGNYSATVLWNGFPVLYSMQDNQFLSSYTGVWPIPSGYKFNYSYPNVTLVAAGSFNGITFDFHAVDQNGVSLMCVKNQPFTPPSGYVSVPTASCIDSPSVLVSAWASSWPPTTANEFLAVSVQTLKVVSGGIYDISVTTSLGATILASSGTIQNAVFGLSPWPIPAGFETIIGLNLDTSTLPPGATVNFAITAQDQTAAQILCLVNGSSKAVHVSIIVTAMTLFLTKHLFQF